MERYGLFFFVFFFPNFFFHGSVATSPKLNQKQIDIMKNLSKNLLSMGVTSGQWNTTDPNPCRWDRVICSNGPNSVVTQLSFTGLSLSNTTFFDLLCHLDSLRYLNLSLNNIATIPNSFFSDCNGLLGLKSLNLSYNRLRGPLGSFASFVNLEILDLSSNFLVGTVDTQLVSWSRLKSLNLSLNFFNGTIPAPVGTGKGLALEELVLSMNQFSGHIPNEIFEYRNLTHLDLSQNSLNGSVSEMIGRLSKLETLVLSANNLIGGIPPNISDIKTLHRFAANQNNFVGIIPSGIARYVRVLDLSYNNLNGEIPSELLSSPNLEYVDLTGNRLHGAIPGNLSRRLYRLRLGGNLLNGSIPATVEQLSDLSYLELNNNNLDAEIPSQLGNCKNLTLLNLASNKLQGRVPKELGKLQQLVILNLQVNNLGGDIPSEIFKLTNLSTLNLSRNSFSGEISPLISGLQKLSNLDLRDNELRGPIPESINTLKYLTELQLGNNKLRGIIPHMPTSLTIALNLSRNLFSGTIPSYLDELVNLEILDLSYNNFSGEIPNSLTSLQSLTMLVLSYNHLSGAIPAFHSYVNVISTGNKDLTNTTGSSNSDNLSKKGRSTTLITLLVVIISLVSLGLVAGVLLLLLPKRFYRVEDEVLQPVDNLPQIINGCFVTTNGIHRSSIDFSKAMETVANPVNIVLKTRFSTYYKAVMPNGACYYVKKLNWSDKIFQVGGHERFGKELEVLGKLSNSKVMVPLAYVLMEDSAYLFYEHVYQGTLFDYLHKGPANALDWASRYSIALGVAQGLTFLHGCTQPVLLLDLSTMSIHLKTLNEPQIGDIELYKVIDPSKSTESLSTVAGSVGCIPPEYAYTMKLAMAGNVYSFGVILLELLTGRQPISEGIDLAKWVLSYSARLDEIEQILDSRIPKTSPAVRSQMLSVLKIALACVCFSPEARPKMRNVLRMLVNAK
ncbi:uncharacterized protein [Typha latifolia]|uniref:uncharacterized protein n=1 Tax=Typha latifolia TaxID=4733 RepID=UPI003C30E302